MTQINNTRRTFLKMSGATLLAGFVTPVVSAKPSPNSMFNLDFSTPTDVASMTASSPGWTLDRYAPEMWAANMFDGDDRLHIDIDESGPTSGFYAYQGKKYQAADGDDWCAGHGSRLSYRFYIDPSWETDAVAQQTGVWLVPGDDTGDISAYSVMEYQDSDASATDEAGFRLFVQSNGGEWRWLGLPEDLGINPTEGGWVDVEAALVGGTHDAKLKWSVNDLHLTTDETIGEYTASTQLLEVIVNSRNAGVDQQYYYDDIALTAPGLAGR
ncbi:twin-arginine translocation signal domain-containing protein [Haladaptatus sp. NG-SE-30]